MPQFAPARVLAIRFGQLWDGTRMISDAVIVVVFCDGGEKYLSERFWDEP
jgi:cysteine synthase